MRKRARKPDPLCEDALAWAREFLPHYLTDELCPFHSELVRDLQSPGKRMIARVAPRGHAKSTLAALAYPLWCICERKRKNIVIITHELSLATQFVRDMRQELESNEALLAAYGDLTREQPDSTEQSAKRSRRSRRKWAEEMFTTSGGVTVHAKGSGGSLRGTRVGPQRPDLIICDDIEKDELVETPEGRRRLERWLRRVVMPALAPKGRLFVLGSLIHYDSLLANLRNKDAFPGWDYKVYRAIECERGEDGKFYKKALWPARWPIEKLEQERARIGTLAFEQEYQARPVDDSRRVFRPEWLRRWKRSEIDERKLIRLMAVDPATGVSGGDFFAVWIGGVDQDSGVIYTAKLLLERIGFVAQVKRIVELFKRFKPQRIGIETNAYQVALKDVLDDIGRKQRLYLPITGIRATANKIARIEASAPFYENGTFRLPPKLSPEAEQQFLHFPKARHDDGPDVCAMAIELARTLRSTSRVEAAALRSGAFDRNGGL